MLWACCGLRRDPVPLTDTTATRFQKATVQSFAVHSDEPEAEDSCAPSDSPSGEICRSYLRDVTSLVHELEDTAQQLESEVEKFPSSARSFLQGSRARYIAVVPLPGTAGVHDRESVLRRWRGGSLAWWKTFRDFKANVPPQNTIGLLRIAKIHYAKSEPSGRGVIVKHKSVSGETSEMMLLFQTKSAGEQWTYTLWSFIRMLRGQSVD
mmetsp:Transcript_44316/g.117540  ORF Transcript_44316/g.117540 Transcript_44316/m.117540 type:complete len:209 (-) Transcript_44316:67-693(-)